MVGRYQKSLDIEYVSRTRGYRLDVYLRLLHKFFLEGVFSPLAESCVAVIGAKRL